MGLVQAAGGVAEIAGGSALAAAGVFGEPVTLGASTVAVVGGVAIAGFGVDNLQAGLRTAFSGQSTNTFGARLISRATGMSLDNSELTYGGLQQVTGGGAVQTYRTLVTETIAPKAWTVGDDIYALTAKGNEPAWSTVRGRFWKNEAASPQYGTWDAQQLDRMRKGLAPQRYNLDKGGIESMDLSHEPIPFRDGGRDILPRWPQDHAAVDPYRRPGY